MYKKVALHFNACGFSCILIHPEKPYPWSTISYLTTLKKSFPSRTGNEPHWYQSVQAPDLRSPGFKWFRSQRSIAWTTTTTTTRRWKRPQNFSFGWLHNVILSVILWVFLSDLTTINSQSEINPQPTNPVKVCKLSFPYSSLKILCYDFVYTAPWKYRIPESWDQPCLRSIHMPIAASHFVSFASCWNQFLAPVAGLVLRGNLFWVEKPWVKNRPFEIYLKVSAQINSWHVEANY